VTTRLTAQVLRSWDELRALEPEWNPLLRSSRADTVFLTWEWVKTWAQVVSPPVRPFVVTIRDAEGRLLGLAPYYHARFRLVGLVPYRALRILGDYGSGAEYLDWIVDAEREGPVSQAIAEALAAHGRSWDCIWMPFVAGWDGALERVLGTCRAAGLRGFERPNHFGFLELPGDFAAYLATLSSNARSMLSRRRRTLGQQGLEVQACSDPEAVPAFLEALFRLNHLRWQSIGRQGSFTRKRLAARFYAQFAPLALKEGWLRFFAARLDGEAKAMQYGYLYRNTFLQMQEGFDPEAPNGLGNVLRSRVIEHCIGEGVAAYDFLAGYTDHKRRWGAHLRRGHDFFLMGPGVKNDLLFRAGLWPTGRYLRPVHLPT
jgi:CelD/BcsL family acetyltransferase involved in cellulose biosynthesis